MAGLNDDVDDDLPPEALDGDLDEIGNIDTSVKPMDYNPAQPLPEDVTIIADNVNREDEDVKPSDLFGIGVVKNELPNLDARFVVLQEESDKALEAQALKETLLDGGGVAQEHALEINELVPGFLNNKLTIQFFSEQKSRTNYKVSLEALDGALDVQYGVLKTSVTELSASLRGTITNLVKIIDEKYMAAYTMSVDYMQNVMKLIGTEKQYVFPSGVPATDILYARIKGFGIACGPDDLESPDPSVKDSLLSMQNVMCTKTSRQNLLHYMNFPAPVPTVLYVGRDIYLQDKDGNLVIENIPENKSGFDDKVHTEVYLESAIRRFAGAVGIKTVRDFRLALSKMSEELEKIEAGLSALDTLEDSPLNLKIETIANKGSEVKEKMLLVGAIASFFEDLHIFMDETNKILDVISKLETHVVN